VSILDGRRCVPLQFRHHACEHQRLASGSVCGRPHTAVSMADANCRPPCGAARMAWNAKTWSWCGEIADVICETRRQCPRWAGGRQVLLRSLCAWSTDRQTDWQVITVCCSVLCCRAVQRIPSSNTCRVCLWHDLARFVGLYYRRVGAVGLLRTPHHKCGLRFHCIYSHHLYIAVILLTLILSTQRTKCTAAELEWFSFTNIFVD